MHKQENIFMIMNMDNLVSHKYKLFSIFYLVIFAHLYVSMHLSGAELMCYGKCYQQNSSWLFSSVGRAEA